MNSFGACSTLRVGDSAYQIFRLDAVDAVGAVDRLPYSLKVLLENLLRTEDGVRVTPDDISDLAGRDPDAEPSREIQFTPARPSRSRWSRHTPRSRASGTTRDASRPIPSG
jgi:aconitate hydratase